MCQGDRLGLVYAVDFRVLTTDFPWGDQALMEQIRFGLRNDVKDSLLTFPKEPQSLTEAISRVMRYDNRLFEQHLEQQLQMPRTRSELTYTSIISKHFPKE